jgi:hypothetical protein
LIDPTIFDVFNLRTIQLDGAKFFIGDGDFGYSATIANDVPISLYRFSVAESMYEEFYDSDEVAADVAIFKRLREIATRTTTPTLYVFTSKIRLILP